MTVGEALRAAAGRLATTSDTARLDAEVLMAHALGVNRSDLLLRHMDGATPGGFDALINRRALHEPVAYIVGSQEFYGRPFAVQPGVLIPRADSETIIEAALEAVPDPRRVLDLGVGSGALMLTVMAERLGCQGVGIDASSVAIDVAKRNALALGLDRDCELHQRDWRGEGWEQGLGTFDLILCNPPYVETDAALDPTVRNFEPAEALYAGSEGLDDYRVIIPQLRKLLLPDGIAILEIGATQADAVSEIAEKAGFRVKTRQDLANRQRALILS